MVLEPLLVFQVSNVVEENCPIAGPREKEVVSGGIHAQLADFVALIFQNLKIGTLLPQVPQENRPNFGPVQGETSLTLNGTDSAVVLLLEETQNFELAQVEDVHLSLDVSKRDHFRGVLQELERGVVTGLLVSEDLPSSVIQVVAEEVDALATSQGQIVFGVDVQDVEIEAVCNVHHVELFYLLSNKQVFEVTLAKAAAWRAFEGALASQIVLSTRARVRKGQEPRLEEDLASRLFVVVRILFLLNSLVQREVWVRRPLGVSISLRDKPVVEFLFLRFGFSPRPGVAEWVHCNTKKI